MKHIVFIEERNKYLDSLELLPEGSEIRIVV